MKNRKLNNDEDKLIINIEFEEPLKSLILRECERDDRTNAGLIRVIVKRFFADQLFANSTHQQSKDKIGNLPYYPDELPSSKQAGAE